MTSKRLYQTCLVIFISGSIYADTAATVAIPIVAPPEALTIPNGSAEMHPFDFGPARFQQVYDSSAFAPLAPFGGGIIREIVFRIDFRPIASSVENMQINMSVTHRDPDGLSAVFGENTGLGDIVVVGSRRVVLLAALGFQATVILDQPFFYNPAEGNLLLDFRIFEGASEFPPTGPAAPLDAFNTMGDSISSVYGFGGIGGTMPASGQISSAGLATMFRVVPIPEPSMLALLAFALMCLGGFGWKRIWKG